MAVGKKAIILFNSTGLSGLQKNDAIQALTIKCRQDNYRVSRILYYKDHYGYPVLCKLAELVPRTKEKVTVIFTEGTSTLQTPSNHLVYAVLSALAISGHIELCLYQEQIVLQQVGEHEIKLMQQAVNMSV